MRFQDHDSRYAILRLTDGRPIKVTADDALSVPGRVYHFNEQLFLLLTAAFENNDHDGLENLWAAAHPFVAADDSAPMPVLAGDIRNSGPLVPLPPELNG